MTYSEFKSKYMGVKCGNTTANMGECVGLVSLWMDNLGIAHEWGNAIDLLNNADTSKFDVIYNDPKNLNQFPVQGDIMVFGKPYGLVNGVYYGHTGIVDEATGKDFLLFEQNNPTGNPPEIIGHPNYSGVLGWLHPKDNSQSIILGQSDAFIAICTKLNLPANRDIVLAEIEKLITYEDAMVQKDKQLNDKQKQIEDLEGQIKELGDQQKVITDEKTALEGKVTNLTTTINTQTENIQLLDKQIQELKNQVNQPILSGWKLFIYKLLVK